MSIKGGFVFLSLTASALASPPNINRIHRKDLGCPSSLCALKYRNSLGSFREGHWKLRLTSPPQLFDLSQDLAEAPDVAAHHPDVVQRQSKAAVRLREETLSANLQH